MRSASQKQPMPKIACSVPSGNGGLIGVPRTRCVPGVTIGVSRPGSASSGVGMSLLLRKRATAHRMAHAWRGQASLGRNRSVRRLDVNHERRFTRPDALRLAAAGALALGARPALAAPTDVPFVEAAARAFLASLSAAD